MLKVDRLRKAVNKAITKVNVVDADVKSSFKDIAPNLVGMLRVINMGLRNRDTEENRQYFREYFRALNDYMHMINTNEFVSSKERYGNVFLSPPECAFPQIRDLSEDDAVRLGYRGSKVAYVNLLKKTLGAKVSA